MPDIVLRICFCCLSTAVQENITQCGVPDSHAATPSTPSPAQACYLPPRGTSPAQLDLETKADLIDKVCTSVTSLHTIGDIAHLDVKNDNLLIQPGAGTSDTRVTPCDLGTTATAATLARLQRNGRCAVSNTFSFAGKVLTYLMTRHADVWHLQNSCVHGWRQLSE
jgi:hypothetical protein